MAGTALSDFGRMPTSRKVLLFAVIGALFFGLYWQFAYKKLASELDKEEQALGKTRKELKDINDKIDQLPEMRSSKARLDEIIASESRALPQGANVPEFFGTLERKFTESGVTFVRWQRKPEEAYESFVKITLDVEINGTFFQLKKFFGSLAEKKRAKNAEPSKSEDRDRIVSVENLTLDKPTLRAREIVMTAKFNAVTFRQQDPVPAAEGALPANLPDPAKASSTPSTNAPPMPSNALDRVQKKVDDSMKKDEQRVKDGIADPGAHGNKGGN